MADTDRGMSFESRFGTYFGVWVVGWVLGWVLYFAGYFVVRWITDAPPPEDAEIHVGVLPTGLAVALIGLVLTRRHFLRIGALPPPAERKRLPRWARPPALFGVAVVGFIAGGIAYEVVDLVTSSRADRRIDHDLGIVTFGGAAALLAVLLLQRRFGRNDALQRQATRPLPPPTVPGPGVDGR